jgi:hypothetical protein
VAVGFREPDHQGNALSLRDEVVFRALFPAICGVRPRLVPPKVALTEELSINARRKSILLAPRSLDSSSLWIAFHTPARCHACRYRQQLIPLPQPNSWGSSSQGMPLFSTYRMPIKARRGSIGLRPGCLRRRGLGGGKMPRISSQSLSGTNASTFKAPSQLRRYYPRSSLSRTHYVRAS